jgi:hypothetical protein
MKKLIIHIKALLLFLLLLIYNFLSYPMYLICHIMGIKAPGIIRNRLLNKINQLWDIITYNE